MGSKRERKRTSPDYWKNPWPGTGERRRRDGRSWCSAPAWPTSLTTKRPQGAREDLWQLIRNTPNLEWQLLTKRPQNFDEFLPKDWNGGYPNIWLGISAENQEEYGRRWPILARTPATLRFVSYEPALGRLSMREHGRNRTG